MARNYAALLHEYLEEMEDLSDAEFGRLCRSLLAYSMTGASPALSGNERFYFKRVKMQEDRFQASYDDLTEKRREAGRKGAEAKLSKAKHSQAKPSKTSNTKTETEIKTNTSPAIAGRSSTRFTPPTIEQVRAYCLERGNAVDPQRFVDYYSANGWIQGKGKAIKDWKAAVRLWEQRDRKPQQQTSSTLANARKNSEWMRKALEEDDDE